MRACGATDAARPNGLEARLKMWTPAVVRKAPDHFVSSSYTTAKMFVPSYINERRPCIEKLLANDYQRIWWQEKLAWDKTFAGTTATKRLLPRKLIKRKIATCVTVKYSTSTDRFKGKGKGKARQKTDNSNVAKSESARRKDVEAEEKHDRAKPVECEETKVKRREEEAQLNDHEEEAQLNDREDTQLEKGEETKLEN